MARTRSVRHPSTSRRSRIVGAHCIDQPADGNLVLLATQSTTEIVTWRRRSGRSMISFHPRRGIAAGAGRQSSVPAKSLAELIA
jgi:hypothetical protein